MDFEMFSADSKSNYRQCGKLWSLKEQKLGILTVLSS